MNYFSRKIGEKITNSSYFKVNATVGGGRAVIGGHLGQVDVARSVAAERGLIFG